MSHRIIIRTPNHLGDCVMALPMINETHEAYPGSSVTLLTPEHLASLFYANPGVDHIVNIPRDRVHGLLGVLKIKDIIAEQPYDIAFVLPPSFGSASSFKLAGVPERVGYIADGRRLLLTKPLPLPEPLWSQHRAELYFNLLRRASNKDLSFVEPRLFLADEDIAAGIALLESYGVGPDDAYAVIAFQAVAESRRWGLENYTTLADSLMNDYDLKVVLIGGPEDRSAGEEISTGLGDERVVNLAGKTSIREVAAVCAGSRVFVGNDSGPAHLAAAVGTPMVVLSGADDPRETSPLGSEKRLVYLEGLDCISCRKNKCPEKGDRFMQCMNGIPLEVVLVQVDQLLNPN